MQCAVCKNKFITTKTQEEFTVKKSKSDEKLCDMIDEKTSKTVLNELCMWKKILQAEALLLQPDELPKKCSNKFCNAKICKYCYNKNNKFCLTCSKTQVKSHT
jgi:hypothetical protein